jgi:putative glycosyltransferase (TIGR04348 family)
MICPAPRWSRKGNWITAARWAGLLAELGHGVTIRQEYTGEPCDVMIALHARRSAAAIRRFAREQLDQPLVVALTGTDLYRDIRTSRVAQESLELATRLVVLQPRGVDELPAHLHGKTRSILQSAVPARRGRAARRRRAGDVFRVSVLGHLRHEKDPLRTAMATRLLPASSRVHVTHLGAALTPWMGRWATAETSRNPRYTWRGEVSHSTARRVLAESDLTVLTSRMEGGANVLSEALADRVPIVASRIASTEGILGSDYAGLFPVGDTRQLAELLHRAETDKSFYGRLRSLCHRLAASVRPAAERAAWRRLIAELI